MIGESGPTSTVRAGISAEVAVAPIEVLGIRHHGPGSARSVVAALDQLQPSHVVIEGPPELDEIPRYAASAEMVPPVAGAGVRRRSTPPSGLLPAGRILAGMDRPAVGPPQRRARSRSRTCRPPTTWRTNASKMTIRRRRETTPSHGWRSSRATTIQNDGGRMRSSTAASPPMHSRASAR